MNIRVAPLIAHSVDWPRRAMAYTLVDAAGKPYLSPNPGMLGGHRRTKGYGRLDYRSALMWIARGKYLRHRVSFDDEATAFEAGYRPCAACLPQRYGIWKFGRAHFRDEAGAR